MQDRELINSYQLETAVKLKQVEELSDPQYPRVFHVTRCSSCGGQLDLPSVHFMCHHSYHQRSAFFLSLLLLFSLGAILGVLRKMKRNVRIVPESMGSFERFEGIMRDLQISTMYSSLRCKKEDLRLLLQRLAGVCSLCHDQKTDSVLVSIIG